MSRTKKLTFLILFSLSAFACTVPTLLTALQPTPQPAPLPTATVEMITAPADATPTPTPFLPMLEPAVTENLPFTNTETITETVGPPWGDYPGPEFNTAMEIPPPVGVFDQPPGQVNVLLLGSDQRPNTGGYRTDTMLLLTINPLDGSASLTSFPRDLYVYIPGWTMQRINTAQAHGGFPLTALTFEYNFGVRPDRYVIINFWGFSQLINSLGGIYVDVGRPLSDHRHGYGTYSVPAGTVYMDGDTALWYVRSRYTSNDFDRTRRQQEVILGIFYRLLSLDAVQRASEIYDLYKQNVTTDLVFNDIAPFLPLAGQLGNTENIRRYVIGGNEVIPWRTPGGAAVLLPNRNEILPILRQALSIPE